MYVLRVFDFYLFFASQKAPIARRLVFSTNDVQLIHINSIYVNYFEIHIFSYIIHSYE